MDNIHDPLCPAFNDDNAWWAYCRCDLIRKARADERVRIAQKIEAYGGALSAAQWQRVAARIARGES